MSTPSIGFAEIVVMKKLQKMKMTKKMEELAAASGSGKVVHADHHHGNLQTGKPTSGSCFFAMFKKIHPSGDHAVSVSEIPRT